MRSIYHFLLQSNRNARRTQQTVDHRRPYRILCLDGGGVRGILTIALLKRICNAHPTFLDNVDFICGNCLIAFCFIATHYHLSYSQRHLCRWHTFSAFIERIFVAGMRRHLYIRCAAHFRTQSMANNQSFPSKIL